MPGRTAAPYQNQTCLDAALLKGWCSGGSSGAGSSAKMEGTARLRAVFRCRRNAVPVARIQEGDRIREGETNDLRRNR